MMSFSTRLFVGNLPENFKEDDLRKEFSAYGDVTNLDVKTKPGTENSKKIFAFITINASSYNVETCIKHFSDKDFYGQKLYVTRARESFLERLQREREQAQTSSANKIVPENIVPIQKPDERVVKNVNKRKFNDNDTFDDQEEKNTKFTKRQDPMINSWEEKQSKISKNNKNNDSGSYKSQLDINISKDVLPQDGNKKFDADKKRLESIKRKRQEFMEKKKIIKTGLTSIDKQSNKKVIFSDNEEETIQGSQILNHKVNTLKHKVSLFDDVESGSGSDDETNFNMKKQFEGKKGQKVLELQSRYKADKRFTLDERFVENGHSEDEEESDNEAVDLEQVDEKSKQLNILQNVLGVSIKTRSSDVKDKTKMKPGMLRFDPNHPDHMKFLAAVEQKPESKKSKKKNKDLRDDIPENVEPVVEKVEVSKDQFYKVSDTLKEAITQPKEFSLRSLFANDNVNDEEPLEQSADFIPIVNNKEKKVRNPLDPGEKNPFVYDSSDSENEEEKKIDKSIVHNKVEPKIVWKEKLFFVDNDERLTDALLFFTKKGDSEPLKDRRELKSIMKKRIYNKERKSNMFKKKIGGRKKSMKKSFRK